MASLTIPGPSMLWPPDRWGVGSNPAAGHVVTNSTALNAATDKTAMIGYLYINGKPTSAKTLSAAGGGSIGFRTGAVTWANAATNLDIGIQGVSATAGPPARPDGAYSAKATIIPGTDTLTANAWNTIVMDASTVSLTHGDLVAVVWDMAALGGADSVVLSCGTQTSTVALPTVNEFQAGAWLTTNGARNPIVVITFDDGTLGTIENSVPFSSVAAEAWNTGSAADEHGLLFQVPFDCTVDGFWWESSGASSSADGEIKLYSTPFGTPGLVKSVTRDGNNAMAAAASTQRIFSCTFSPAVSLTANTDYVLAWLATTATNREMTAVTVADANHLKLWPGGSTNRYKVTRDASAGAFSGTTTVSFQMGVMLASIDTGNTGANTYSRGRVVNT